MLGHSLVIMLGYPCVYNGCIANIELFILNRKIIVT